MGSFNCFFITWFFSFCARSHMQIFLRHRNSASPWKRGVGGHHHGTGVLEGITMEPGCWRCHCLLFVHWQNCCKTREPKSSILLSEWVSLFVARFEWDKEVEYWNWRVIVIAVFWSLSLVHQKMKKYTENYKSIVEKLAAEDVEVTWKHLKDKIAAVKNLGKKKARESVQLPLKSRSKQELQSANTKPMSRSGPKYGNRAKWPFLHHFYELFSEHPTTGITLSTDTVDFESHDETSGGEGSGHQSWTGWSDGRSCSPWWWTGGARRRPQNADCAAWDWLRSHVWYPHRGASCSCEACICLLRSNERHAKESTWSYLTGPAKTPAVLVWVCSHRPVSNKADNDPAGQWNEDNGHFQWSPVTVIQPGLLLRLNRIFGLLVTKTSIAWLQPCRKINFRQQYKFKGSFWP